MTSCCECYLDDGEPGEDVVVTRVKRTTKEWVCMECGGPILPGQSYERINGKWEGCRQVMRTCVVCLRIRDDLCSCTPYGCLWENLVIGLGLMPESVPDTVLSKLNYGEILCARQYDGSFYNFPWGFKAAWKRAQKRGERS